MQSTYSIQDDRFDISDLENKKLILEFQPSKFVFTVFNKNAKHIEWLEDFTISDWKSELPTIFNNHQFLKANFWEQVVVVFHSEQKAIVPSSFISKLDLVNFIPGFESDEAPIEIKTFKLNDERTLLYHVPLFFRDFLSSNYLAKEIFFVPMEVCQPILIDSLVVLVSNNGTNFSTYGKNVLNETKYVTIKDQKQFEMYIDFYMDAYKQLVLLGSITSYSPLFNVLKNKQINLTFAEIPPHVKFSQYFSEVPKHKYFTIFNYINYF